MQLPPAVRREIEARADAVGFPALKRAADALSDAYRAAQPIHISGDERIAAYLVTRMPATYAAARAALGELPDLPIASILDIGAGTGAASLAARDRFPEAAEIAMIERDPALSEVARAWLPTACASAADLSCVRELPPHDLVIAAYSLGEIHQNLAALLWRAARMALVVIEPGTPQGAARIAAIRNELLATGGAHVAAPCPADMPCPLVSPDWCHFAARVERSSLHRKVKGGELGYEDEKYSYVALVRKLVRKETPRAPARVLRRPRHAPGLIELELCTPAGPRVERVTKRDRERFRAARESSWGSRY